MRDDLIRDILARVMALDERFTQAQALQIEQQIRHDWGGERVFIAKRKPDPKKGARHDDEVKHAAIEAVENGVSVHDAAREHGISRRRIYQLLKH